MLQGGSVHHLVSVKALLQALSFDASVSNKKGLSKSGNTNTGADEIFSFNTHTTSSALGVSVTGPIFISSPSKSYSASAKTCKVSNEAVAIMT